MMKRFLSAGLAIALSVLSLQILIPSPAAQAVAPSGSIYFNQTSIKHAFNSILDVGEVVGGNTESFTVEMWIKPTYTGSCALSGTVNATNGLCAEGLWAAGFEADGDVNIGSDRTSSGCVTETEILVIRHNQWCSGSSGANTFPTINVWSHIAWSVDATGNFSLYINGVRKIYAKYSIDMSLRGINRFLYIGKSDRAVFTGYMTNVRLVKGAALYTGATITVPTTELSSSTPSGSTQFLLQARDYANLLNDSSANAMNFSPDGSYVLANISPASTPIGGVTWSSDSPFTPPPSITSLSVTTGLATGGTSSVITGTYLSSATSVTIGGNTAVISNNTSTSITITTPAGTDGAKNVVVTTAGGSATSVGAYTYFSKFAVSYAGGAGSTGIPPTQVSIAPNETFTVASGSTLSKPGYTFSGWRDGGNSEYLPGSIYTVTNSEVTLTAQWTINNYVVNFLSGANGSITGTTPQNVNHGSSTSQVSAVPDSHYHFVNWSDGSNVNPRTISSVETSTTLTATFAIDTVTANYSAGSNGTISGSASQIINFGESTTSVTAVASSDFHFLSWDDGVMTASRVDSAVLSSFTKTAGFAIDTYSIAFNSNGGTGDAVVSADFNSDVLLSAPNVTRNNYSLRGWAETTTAGVLSSWNVLGNKTLYAMWMPMVYTISYSPESGTVTISSKTFTVLSMPSTWQIPTRSNYSFDGWYSDRTWSTLRGNGGSTFTSNETETVYAKWTQASLVGLSNPTSFGTIIATAGNDGGISATRLGTRVEVDYFADSLPNNTVITAYLQGNTTRAASVLAGVPNLLLSVVVAWKAPDETVPDVDSAKSAIRMKISNSDIKSGAKVYSIVNNTSTLLATANQDGYVIIELRIDPEIVIANPVVLPAPPIQNAPSIVVAPVVDNSEVEAKAKLVAEAKAAQEEAERALRIAREKADLAIKAAQDAADLAARLRAEAEARVAAELKAKEDAARAAKLAAQKIVPEITLYSISTNLKLSIFDSTYLKTYVATLKPNATITCIGYIYTKNTSLTVATLKAKRQATAVCAMIQSQRKTLATKVLLYPAYKAPKAAIGAKWVAVSYRVDGFKS